MEETIKISLNGKPNEIKAGMTVSELLEKWRMRPEVVTVEINEDILQKLDYETTVIKNGDKVEFVFYMGGGVGAGPAAAAAHFLTSVPLPENKRSAFASPAPADERITEKP